MATSIDNTNTELFVGELLDAIANDAPTPAEDCVPDNSDPFDNVLPGYGGPLELGFWKGEAGLWGTYSQEFSGVNMVWDGTIEASFDFAINDDPAKTASGSWDFAGDAKITGALPQGDLDVDQQFTGSGEVSGGAELLNLNGTSVTTGTATINVGGNAFSNPIDSAPVTNPPIEVRVRAVACGEGYGDWTYSAADNIEQLGFTTSFDGFWAAFRDNEAGAALALADFAGDNNARAESLFALTNNYILVYNQFVDDFHTWDTQSVFNFMDALEIVLNTFRNLTECDLEFFGEDNVTTAINALLFLLQGVLQTSGDLEEPPTGAEFRQLVHVAVRTGAIGSAAPNGLKAEKAERGLVLAGNRVLELHRQPDPTVDAGIDVNEDTKEVFRIGALMDFTFGDEDYRYPAKEVWAEYQLAVAAEGGS